MKAQRSQGSRRRRFFSGSVLLEVSLGLALAAFVAVATLRQSMLALSAGQWAAMQAITDSYLTRETALATRLPYDELTQEVFWPPNEAASTQTVVLGSMADPAGGPPREVQAQLTRSSQTETIGNTGLPDVTVLRLDSVLSYQIGGQPYIKSRSTLRTQ
jgi:hypothetical protein